MVLYFHDNSKNYAINQTIEQDAFLMGNQIQFEKKAHSGEFVLTGLVNLHGLVKQKLDILFLNRLW